MGHSCEFRIYDTMTKLAHASDSDRAGPPLHMNYRSRWVTVTDQRPLKWTATDLDTTEVAKIIGSPSLQPKRGVMAGGANAVTLPVDGTYVKIVTVAAGTSIEIDLSTSAEDEISAYDTSGTQAAAGYGLGLESYFYTDKGTGLATTNTNNAVEAKGTGFVTISGCDSNPDLNKEFYYTATGYATTSLTFTIPTSGPNELTELSTDGAASGGCLSVAASGTNFDIGDPIKITQNTGTPYTLNTVNLVVGSTYYVQASTGTTVCLAATPGGSKLTLAGGASASTKFVTDLGWNGLASACVGDTVTFSSRAGTLIDSKAIAVGDRVKALVTDDSEATHQIYETRSVDKVWGSGLDVTMFSVKDPFVQTRVLQDVLMWVDESGTTEDLECSRRGLCDGETGVCQCFAGYTGGNCNKLNALSE
jgi:hypothetical protein